MKGSLRPMMCALSALLVASSYAWIDTGHMVIAAIAKRDLTAKALAESERLLKIGGTDRSADFITASCWADDIRNTRRETSTWHYLDLHFRADGKKSDNKPDEENAAWAIDKFSKILGDKSKSDSERADALRFLLHFVGDLHQPLHGTARDTDEFPKGDRGGNDFKILPPASFKEDSRPPQNLHALWDMGAGLFTSEKRPLAADGQRRIQFEALALRAALPRNSFRALGEQNPLVWAKESMEAARKYVYALPDKSEPTELYLSNGRTVAAQRATLAGYRLADLLNRLIG